MFWLFSLYGEYCMIMKMDELPSTSFSLYFVGLGLNVSNQEPTTCLNALLQKLGCAAHHLKREEIMAAFFNKFESFYDIFISQGEHFHFCDDVQSVN